MAFANGSGVLSTVQHFDGDIHLLSAFTALTLTPALCATLLKPWYSSRVKAAYFSAWFSNSLSSPDFVCHWSGICTEAYWPYDDDLRCIMFGIVCRAVHLTIIIFADESGLFMSSIQLPSDATMQRTLKVNRYI
ncbi:hypothetical protein MJ584_15930 [Klebsiella pneumoniae]|nr:hypothetical protein MJ584_15930 [Klebsiella pneumoniae]